MVLTRQILYRIKTACLRLKREFRLWNINRQVLSHSRPLSGHRPVVLFNASSRLSGLSLNAAFTLLTGWGLQLAGVPVIYYACKAGMTRCVLGTNPDDPTQEPPCKTCITQTKKSEMGVTMCADHNQALLISGITGSVHAGRKGQAVSLLTTQDNLIHIVLWYTQTGDRMCVRPWPWLVCSLCHKAVLPG